MTQELDWNQFHPKASAEIFPGKQRRTFAYPFPVVDNVVQMDGHTMLYTPLIFADLTSILNLLSEMFSKSDLIQCAEEPQCLSWN